ncbi:hypothetical protein ACFCYB_39125 [Streptomyces sp. NPDC056309]|uniref:hypothetical protein n=1 Tax=unclassified Streptomyces TaxID=2593676 RepID=UPI0035D91E9B
MARTDYQRIRARVVRAGDDTAHLSIAAWCRGQITVPVPTLGLTAATGLAHHELPGTVLVVTANLAAATYSDIDPHDWQLAPDGDRMAAFAALQAG